MILKIRQFGRTVVKSYPSETAIECERYTLTDTPGSMLLHCWNGPRPADWHSPCQSDRLVATLTLGYEGPSELFVMERGKTVDHREFNYSEEWGRDQMMRELEQQAGQGACQ